MKIGTHIICIIYKSGVCWKTMIKSICLGVEWGSLCFQTPTSQPVSMHLFSGQQNNQTMLLQTQIGQLQSTQHVQQHQVII
jgi:hypothetical protein